jgi:segregation and condensation protein B
MSMFGAMAISDSSFVIRHFPQATSLPRNHRLPLIYRLRDDSSELGPADPHARDPKLSRLEAALMLADEPLPARKLAAVADLADASEAHHLIERLKKLYDADGTAFQIEDIAGGYQLLTRPVYHGWLNRLRRTGRDLRLSAAALETLAIVAYRQPIMRAEIENVRGVQCGDVLSTLMEKGVVKIAGRHESLGRPVLYGTTKKFLQAFGLNSLKDLPEVELLKRP